MAGLIFYPNYSISSKLFQTTKTISISGTRLFHFLTTPAFTGVALFFPLIKLCFNGSQNSVTDFLVKLFPLKSTNFKN